MSIAIRARVNGIDKELEAGGFLDALFGNTPGLSIVRGTAGWNSAPPGANGSSPLTTNADGATVTFDLSIGIIHQVILGGNRTLAVKNAALGQTFYILLQQDGTGSRTVTWFSTIKWPGGSPPTLTTGANKFDGFGFIVIGTGSYLNISSSANL